AKILRKKSDLTAVVVEPVAAANWFIANRSLADHGKATFFVEVRVVRGTNIKEEKAAYLREIFRGMEALLGSLHPESYVHVHEPEGDGHGYGARAQDPRGGRGNRSAGRPRPPTRGHA